MLLNDLFKSGEKEFLQKIQSKYGIEVAEPVKKIVEWARNKKLDVKFSGKQDMSCSPTVYHKERDIKLIVIWTSGTIYLPFTFGKNGPFCDSEAKRIELMRRFKDIPVNFDSSKPKSGVITSDPKIHLGSLRRENVLENFLTVLKWELQEIKES